MVAVKIVKIYYTEGERAVTTLMHYLHEEVRVKGVTVFRGISGFGKSGSLHSSNLTDLSLDLPLVIEFFDVPQKINKILEDLQKVIEPGHLVTWLAETNE